MQSQNGQNHGIFVWSVIIIVFISILATFVFYKINIKKINLLPKLIKNKVALDIKKITSKRNFLNKKTHILMGVLNITPDSFSDGGKFNNNKKSKDKIRLFFAYYINKIRLIDNI